MSRGGGARTDGENGIRQAKGRRRTQEKDKQKEKRPKKISQVTEDVRAGGGESGKS